MRTKISHRKLFDTPKSNSQSFLPLPTISTRPKEILTEPEFRNDFVQFTTDLPISQEVKDNIKYLYVLYSEICKNGGLVHVLAENILPEIMSRMSINFASIKNMSP